MLNPSRPPPDSSAGIPVARKIRLSVNSDRQSHSRRKMASTAVASGGRRRAAKSCSRAVSMPRP